MTANNEWRDIETAPKDGSEILLYKRGKIATARWFENFENYDGDKNPVKNCWYEGYEWGYNNFFTDPTHWLLLPPPPKKSIQQIAKEHDFDERSKEDKRKAFELNR